MTANEFATWATVGASVVTAVTTVVLARLTWVMARASEQMAQATRQPLVVVTLESNDWSWIHTDLVIENTGNSPAFDVAISFDPPLLSRRDRKPEAEVPMNRISVLRPNAPLRNWIGRGHDFLEKAYRVSISWTATPGSPKREVMSYDLDLGHFKNLHVLGSGDPQVVLAQETKKLREAVERHLRR